MESKNFNYLLGSENEVPKDFDIDQRDDPDVGCKKLYDDEIIAFFGNSNDVENWKQKYGTKPPFYTIRLIKKQYLFSSDYIGPSVYWARERGISDDRIRDFLTICRRLGGIYCFLGAERDRKVLIRPIKQKPEARVYTIESTGFYN